MDEDAGFWPAYVAAIAGLIQGMLLVLAVMTIALVQVVTAIGEQAKAMAEASQKMVERTEAQTELEVVFSRLTWRVDAPTRLAIQKAVQQLVGQGVQHWRLALSADLNDGLTRRVAYLRVTMVRNVLLSAGIPGVNIDMALIDTPEASNEDGIQTVKIQTQTRAPKLDDGAPQ